VNASSQDVIALQLGHPAVRDTIAIASVTSGANEHDCSALQLEPGSYRDRYSVVSYQDGQVFRGLSERTKQNRLKAID
jgi:hypothetical protein